MGSGKINNVQKSVIFHPNPIIKKIYIELLKFLIKFYGKILKSRIKKGIKKATICVTFLIKFYTSNTLLIEQNAINLLQGEQLVLLHHFLLQVACVRTVQTSYDL